MAGEWWQRSSLLVLPNHRHDDRVNADLGYIEAVCTAL